MNKLFLISLVFLLVLGCGEPPAEDSSAPSVIYDAAGVQWELRGEAKFTSYTTMLEAQREKVLSSLRDQFAAGAMDNETFDRAVENVLYGSFPIDKQPEPGEQTVEQLAESLRGVRLINGREYISAPDYEMAQWILTAKVSGRVVKPSEISEPPEPTREKACCGTDGRFETTVYNDYSRVGLSEVGCTVGFISSNVGITAAHCLYDTVANAWLSVKHTSVGAGEIPYYRRQTSVGTMGPVLTCHNATLSSGWAAATSNGDVAHDYAVIDFSKDEFGGTCPNTTPIANWNGLAIRDDSELESAGLWGVGYPGWVHLSGGSVNGPGRTFMLTRLNGTWGYSTIIDGVSMFAANGVWVNVAGTQIQHLADATQGDSGRPMLDYITSGNYQVGIHSGVSAGDAENLDRRIDSTVWAFIQANSPL